MKKTKAKQTKKQSKEVDAIGCVDCMADKLRELAGRVQGREFCEDHLAHIGHFLAGWKFDEADEETAS